MNKRIFNNDKLITYDKISIVVYLLLTIIVSKIVFFFEENETQKSIVMAYSFLTPLALYVFSYKSLRNIKMLIVWIAFSIYHLFLYETLVINYDLMFFRGHAAHGLQYTILFVILFEVIRISHLKIVGYELVSLGSYGARTDLWDERKIRISDIICFFIYFPIWILVATLH